jgi:hypothetical protein
VRSNPVSEGSKDLLTLTSHKVYLGTRLNISFSKLNDIVLRIVPDAERETVLYKWNDAYAEATDSFCLHELFSKQAEKTPDYLALVFRDKKITYRQLISHKITTCFQIAYCF